MKQEKLCALNKHEFILLAVSYSGLIKYWKCSVCKYKTDWNPRDATDNTPTERRREGDVRFGSTFGG